ncbi:MAG: M20/M25/M40 family metallo-hydrolase [Bradyrhizobium sp.]|uniref:M20/M25/M40 family metallo-hydrolase n=1 Tax=Bradyrhizobium sp. TaxID=376 RepID=UPI003C79C960
MTLTGHLSRAGVIFQSCALGFEVTEKVGKTGLVAIYKNGDGPTIMVRTELDALPMEEKTSLAYASHDKTTWNDGETFVAHSCGHDIHMASWVGTAKTLVGLKDRWQGTLMFIAQPAEETVSGAKAMLADGLFTRFKKPDFGFALHDAPSPTASSSIAPASAPPIPTASRLFSTAAAVTARRRREPSIP